MNKEVKKWLEMAKVQPSKEMIKLYCSLIDEEYKEIEVAAKDHNYAEIVDGAIDLMWVTIGLLEMMEVDVERAMDEVTASNFSKFTRARKIAELSAERYTNERFVPAYVDELEDDAGKYYIVRRKSDNKILKPATWTKPDWSWLNPPEHF